MPAARRHPVGAVWFMLAWMAMCSCPVAAAWKTACSLAERVLAGFNIYGENLMIFDRSISIPYCIIAINLMIPSQSSNVKVACRAKTIGSRVSSAITGNNKHATLPPAPRPSTAPQGKAPAKRRALVRSAIWLSIWAIGTTPPVPCAPVPLCSLPPVPPRTARRQPRRASAVQSCQVSLVNMHVPVM